LLLIPSAFSTLRRESLMSLHLPIGGETLRRRRLCEDGCGTSNSARFVGKLKVGAEHELAIKQPIYDPSEGGPRKSGELAHLMAAVVPNDIFLLAEGDCACHFYQALLRRTLPLLV
jgi:hypothetical protein